MAEGERNTDGDGKPSGDQLSTPQKYVLFPPRVSYKRRLREYAGRLISITLVVEMFVVLYFLFASFLIRLATQVP